MIPIGAGIVLLVLGLGVGALFGMVLGDHWVQQEREDAIKAGVARWELESQDNPTPVFRWNVPESIESSSATGPEQR